ncbi:uncharacterized protein LOC110191902 [Drosophila serrata]|uniref:uncharacterized protein LOC110191902 n=1 Tax=Drosophila serrata TaxID=7274 RepID=UPI000A1D04B3|nr:uncharacterized protein LOC110191902 [Drosophila serrata]
MRSQVQFRFGQLLIVACALHLVISQDFDYCSEDPGDDVTSDCPGKDDYFAVEVNEGCKERFYCFRRLNQTCNDYQAESQCERGLSCSCGRCMNCDKHDRCYMELCPHYETRKNCP